MAEEYTQILDKINSVDKNVELAKNEIVHVTRELREHIKGNEKHKEDYFKWRRGVDLELQRTVKECPVKEKVTELDKKKISKKSFYSTCAILVAGLAIAKGVMQYFKTQPPAN